MCWKQKENPNNKPNAAASIGFSFPCRIDCAAYGTGMPLCAANSSLYLPLCLLVRSAAQKLHKSKWKQFHHESNPSRTAPRWYGCTLAPRLRRVCVAQAAADANMFYDEIGISRYGCSARARRCSCSSTIFISALLVCLNCDYSLRRIYLSERFGNNVSMFAHFDDGDVDEDGNC